MATKKISELIAAGTLDGNEIVEISVLSTTVKITAATISAQASDNSYNDSGNGFVTAGFAIGDNVKVAGFTGNVANNIHSGKLTAVAAGKLTVGGTDGDVIVDDAAGESVTITKWVTRRSTLAAIAALGGSGLPSGGTVGQVLTKQSGTDGDADWADPTGGSGSGVYRFGSFFTDEPATSEVVMAHPAPDAFTLPIDLAGSVFAPMTTSTNPSTTTTFSLKLNGVEFGTVAVSSSGVVTFDSTEQDIVADDLIELVAPADSNGMTGWAFTFRAAGAADSNTYTPPVSTDFPTVINAPTVVDGTKALIMTSAAATPLIRGILKAMPGGSFSVITRTQAKRGADFNGAGILFRGSDGKYVAVHLVHNSGVRAHIDQFSSASVYNSNAGSQIFSSSDNVPLWLRADFDDATQDITGYWSYNGIDWISLGTSSYLGTADGFGPGTPMNHASINCIAWFEHWAEA